MSKELQNTPEMLTYWQSTQDIEITVYPQYIAEHSEPEMGIYSFIYTVTVENSSDATVQLLRRHWHVYSGGVLYTEVQGDGVVGEQPVLQPGDGFQYSSGSVIKDPVGSMRGVYTFKEIATRGKSRIFDVAIPNFDLMCPFLIH